MEHEKEKHSKGSPIERERRPSQDKGHHKEKHSTEGPLIKKKRLEADKAIHKKTYRQPNTDCKEELIDKASLTHGCTSECIYRPKASVVVVRCSLQNK